MKIQRKFILGDQWLYCKVYTGYKTADKILTNVISPLTQQLIDISQISHWFFIRYADPDFHLRVRFFVTDIKYLGPIINAIHTSLSPFLPVSECTGALIHKVQYDTYSREIERYGERFIELSEQLFYYDSVMAIQLINLLKGKDGENFKWQVVLRAVDELLNSFRYTLTEKQELMKILQNNFGNEFNISNDFRRQFGKNYRLQRIQIEQMLEMQYGVDKDISELLSPIIHKNKQIKEIAKLILQNFNHENVNLERNRLLMSYIHMLINRIFRTNQRKHELVLYDYLFRYYDSKMRRKIDEEKRKKIKGEINN